MRPRFPFIEHVGLQFGQPEPGFSRCWLKLTEVHLNGNGVVHGGVLFTLADTGMGAALFPTLATDESCATLEIKINYFKAVRDGTLVCTTEMIHRGKTVANLEASVRAGDVLVAKANGSFSIFKRRASDSAG
jgi:acyl-CoA thioesterase